MEFVENHESCTGGEIHITQCFIREREKRSQLRFRHHLQTKGKQCQISRRKEMIKFILDIGEIEINYYIREINKSKAGSL